MNSVSVKTDSHTYPVLIAESSLASCGELVLGHTALRGRCAVLADDHVAELYGSLVLDSLRASGFAADLVTFPHGEQSKSLRCAEDCCEELIRLGLDRKSFLLALGGGVTGDLAGFVAAIYFRGIPFVQIPTSVVAQVDSSVGGKTGVNAKGGKNLIGSFHQPDLVIVDPLTLRTLPDREYREGFAEIIKHGIIADAGLLQTLPSPDDRSDLAPLIERNVRIKAEIVGRDEKETLGVRALLNFGHTIGHAIENAAGYGKFLHGEAISLGILAAMRLSRTHAGFSSEEESFIRGLLERWDLPVDFSDAPEIPSLLQAMKTDKKFDSGSIRFILTKRLGTAFVSSDITESDLRRALESLA